VDEYEQQLHEGGAKNDRVRMKFERVAKVLITMKAGGVLTTQAKLINCVKPLRREVRLSAEWSRSTISTLHLDDLVLLVAKSLSGFSPFVM
jgi:hypothetical protein